MEFTDDFVQTALENLPEYCGKWLKIGLDNGPVDRKKVESLYRKAYKLHGLSEPVFRWYLSPKQAIDEERKLGNKNVSVSDFIGGNHEAGLLASYDFYEHEFGLEFSDQYKILKEICEHSGWSAPYEGVVICCERPVELKFNEKKQAHSENGPAILFRDGFGIYVWNGVKVPKEFYQEGWLTPEKAITWENLEQRRVACEMVGWYNVLKNLNTTVIDKDDDPTTGELVRVSLPVENGETEDQNFLIVRCATERTFALEVPNNMKTALEANAWTWGLEANVYKPEIQT